MDLIETILSIIVIVALIAILEITLIVARDRAQSRAARKLIKNVRAFNDKKQKKRRL